MSGFIRLAPDPDDPTLGLSKDEAIKAANEAFNRAKRAQAVLVSHLGLTALLVDPGTISHGRLYGMLCQAEEQVKRAQAVTQALIESMQALERYQRPERMTPDDDEPHA